MIEGVYMKLWIIILSDPNTGKWYLILMIYLDYVEFEERINYSEKSPFSNIN